MSSVLDWQELEVLKNVTLNKKQTKSAIIADLKKRYDSLRNRATSSLYLIFERLERNGLITSKRIEGKGHKSYVHLTQKGRQRLIVSMKNSFNFLLPSILKVLISEIMKIIEYHLEYENKQAVATILPAVISNHPDFNKYSEKKLKNSVLYNFNFQMNFSDEKDPSRFETVKSIEGIIPIKNDFFDVIFSFMTLGLNEDNQHSIVLEEFKNKLKPGGKLILVEAKESYSIIQQSIKQVTKDYQFFSSLIGYDFIMFNKQKLVSLVQETFSIYNDYKDDYAEFHVLIISKR